MMEVVRLHVHTCTFSAMRWSSQPVSMSLFLKLSVSSNLMRYSTVVLKSPLMDSSFIATTMFLTPTETGTFILAPFPLMKAKQIKKNLTKWPLHGFHPKRNSVQTASPQTREVHQLLPRWNNPRHFYCCGSSALARCLNWVWSPVSDNQTTQKSNNRLQKNVSVPVWRTGTSSGFSLVIRAAMTCPLGLGIQSGLSKLMMLSPQGASP